MSTGNLAGLAQAKELKPVAIDREAALALQALAEILQIVAAEHFYLAAVFAQEQMLVIIQRGNVGVTAIGAMDPLHQPKLFQPLKRAIDGHQAQALVTRPPDLEDVRGGHGLLGFCQGFHYGFARAGEPVAAILQTFEPLAGACIRVLFRDDLGAFHRKIITLGSPGSRQPDRRTGVLSQASDLSSFHIPQPNLRRAVCHAKGYLREKQAHRPRIPVDRTEEQVWLI